MQHLATTKAAYNPERETPEEQRARLRKTAEGQALQTLIDLFPTKRALAEALGSSPEYVSRCVRQGKISKSGALIAERLELMRRHDLRPDVSHDEWERASAGLSIGGKHEFTGDQQILLRDLAAHFGSVKAFCKALGVDIAAFHRWKMRDKISAHGLLKLLALKGLTADLRARVKELHK